jgi:hypothetical protein
MACLGFLLTAASVLAAQPPQGDAPPIVVEGEALARSEIERILAEDNVDTSRSGQEVVQAIRGIRRGRAPEDFWTAYQAHVRAWERFASIEARAEAIAWENPTGLGKLVPALEEATREIGTTFDEVERIALRYGARLPTPPVDTARTI